MIKTQAIAITLSALAGTSAGLVGEQVVSKPEMLPIPYETVGDVVPLQPFNHSPVIECNGITLDDAVDIKIVSECAVGRVGWLKL
ncbi:MAG: hypothetical protein VW683_10500 [Betaproteobacteria bacterium]